MTVYTRESHPREWAIFSSIDTNDDGKVDREELLAECKSFGRPEARNELASALDKDGDGQVDFSEFCQGFAAIAAMEAAANFHPGWGGEGCFGLGVAGNVAGHMAQTGMTQDSGKTPTNIFAFYCPDPPDSHSDAAGQGKILDKIHTFPVTTNIVEYPRDAGASKVQVEPEMAVFVDVTYAEPDADGKRLVTGLAPRRVAAFNDCSIRALEGSDKLSEKKNWGAESKGISSTVIDVDSFAPGTLVDRLVMVSYVLRDGVLHKYSEDAPARNYTMFHEPLLEWIVDRLNNQKNEDKWDDVGELVRAAGYPPHAWIALGAGTYTPWGAENYLKQKDEAVVIVYDDEKFPSGPDAEQVEALFHDKIAADGVVCVHQTFV